MNVVAESQDQRPAVRSWATLSPIHANRNNESTATARLVKTAASKDDIQPSE